MQGCSRAKVSITIAVDNVNKSAVCTASHVVVAACGGLQKRSAIASVM